MIRSFPFFAAALLLAGCAGTPHDDFADVQKLVQEYGGYRVQWNQSSADDAAAGRAVDQLLANPLTVEAAVQIALLNDRHLQATFEDLGIAQADLVQAGLLKNPVFAASWRFSGSSPHGTNSEYSVTQDFLDLLILPLRKKVAAEQFESTKLSVASSVLQLSAAVKTAYYTCQGREQLLDRLQVIVDLNQTAAELAHRQYDAGTTNDLGQTTQQAAYDQSRVDKSQVEAQLLADREHLNRLLGLWGRQTTWTIAPRLPDLPAREIPVERLETLAIEQRMDLAAIRAQLMSFANVLSVTRGYRFFTSVEVGVDTERETDSQRVTGPTLSLQIPLFDQGEARIAKVEAQFRQFQRRFEAMAIDVRSEVREARDRMLAERNLIESYHVLLPERQRILNLTLQQYNGMLKGPFELLLAKQSQVATEQACIDALRDYWIARADLERAVGGRLALETGVTTRPLTSTANVRDNDGGKVPAVPEPLHEMNGAQP